MALINNAPPPIGDPIAQQPREEYKPGTDPQAGMVAQAWADWFANIIAVQEKAAGTVASGEHSAIGVSLGLTTLSDNLNGGLYRINYYVRLSHVDTTSVDIVLSVDWNDGATRSRSTVNLVNNDLSKDHDSAVWPIRVGNLTSVNYSTAVTFGTGDGTYSLDIWLEESAA